MILFKSDKKKCFAKKRLDKTLNSPIKSRNYPMQREIKLYGTHQSQLSKANFLLG